VNTNDPFGRLAALKPRRKRATANGRGISAGEALPAEADALSERLGATIERTRFGPFLVLRRWFPAPELAVSPAALRRLVTLDDERATTAADPARWLFLDTETTGLAGGTGTYAFLVGVGWFDAGGIAVEQYFLRDYHEEHSLLAALAARVAARDVLVTFNGRTFDWPLLETRYRMTRQLDPPDLAAHLDLLHPARQLWRLKLGSVRLSELERHVAGFDRGADLWSAMIPQLYFDYLRGGPAEPLVDVFRHNQMDIRGMAEIAARMLELVVEPERCAGDALELCGLSRLLRRRGEVALARQLYERALAAGLPGALDRAARRELARLAKRDGDFSRATELWEELAAPASARAEDSALEAFEQLAMYYEHHAGEPARAAALTREAMAALEAAAAGGALPPSRYRRLHARLAHRLARLSRRNGLPL
jgi:uncharacterized protein YprB with RNaseH-like and TPR domain